MNKSKGTRSGESRSRLQIARDRNRRLQHLPGFLEGLKKIVGAPIDAEDRLIDLEKSIAIERALQEKLVDLRWEESFEFVKTKHQTRLDEEIQRFFGHFQQVDFLVFLSHWKHMGGLRLNGQELQVHGLALLSWDGDSIYGGTSDLNKLFLFDQTRLDERRFLYEAAYWTSPNGI